MYVKAINETLVEKAASSRLGKEEGEKGREERGLSVCFA